MELDKARSRKKCYRCGSPEHLVRDCPIREKEHARQMVGELTEELCNLWLKDIGLATGRASEKSESSSAGFQQAQE